MISTRAEALPSSVELGDPSPAFRAMIKYLFDDETPLVDCLWRARPYRDIDGLLAAADDCIATASEDRKVQLLNAHSRIGATREELHRHGGLALSEQGLVGAVPPEQDVVVVALMSLNDEYESRFQFRFVDFVAGRPRAAFPAVIRECLMHDRSSEINRGLAAVMAIARARAATLD